METEEVFLDKNQVLAIVNGLPEKISSDDLIERILFIKLIQKRLQETTHVTNEKVMQELSELRQRRLDKSVKPL